MLKTSLQENIITLLVFDDTCTGLLKSVLESSIFEGTYNRKIVEKTFSFIEKFNMPPKEHIVDLLEDELSSPKEGHLYENIIKGIFQLKDVINKQYVLNELQSFIMEQDLKNNILKACDLISAKKIDAAREILSSQRNLESNIFDCGSSLRDTDRFLSFFDKQDERIKIGITALDNFGINLAKKELFTLAALPNAGKSFFLTHVGKIALLQHKKVLHISLEMPEEQVNRRYVLSMFGMSSYNNALSIPKIILDDFQKFRTLDKKDIEVLSLQDSNARQKIADKIKALKNSNLYVKDFPSGTLSIKKLQSFIEQLIAIKKFHPDVILLDYPDLLKLSTNSNKKRFEALTEAFTGVRGLAGIFNCAVAVVSQSNRTGCNSFWLDSSMIAGDFEGKKGISDIFVFFNQTEIENDLGVARLYVDKSRNSKKGQKVLITQNLDCAQFCLQDHLLDRKEVSAYTKYVDPKQEENSTLPMNVPNKVNNKRDFIKNTRETSPQKPIKKPFPGLDTM